MTLGWSLTKGAGWIVRAHPRLFTSWLALMGALVWAGQLAYAVAAAAVVVLPGAAGSFAGRRWPAQWRRFVRAPRDRRKWKRRARQRWPQLCDMCKLSQDYRVSVWSRDRRGKWGLNKVTRTRRPRLKRPKAHGNILELTIRHRHGQTNEDVLKQVEHLVSALGAAEWATSQPNLQTVVVEAVMRDELRYPVHARMPASAIPAEVGVVDLGRRQDGQRWEISLRGQHTLIVGVTGSGKGSVIGGALARLAPCVPAELVELWGVDLKGGVEFGPFAGIFTRIAYTAQDAVALLTGLKAIKEARERTMRASHVRLHTPAQGSPLIVLAIDELAAFAYDGTPAGKKLAAEFGGLLGLMLTQGRALGISVLAAQQDPRKEVLNLRDRFTQNIVLRTASADETTMALGRGHHIPAHLIRPDAPGTAYVILEDRKTVKVRADFYSDRLLVAIGKRFRPPGIAGVEPRGRSHASLTADVDVTADSLGVVGDAR